MQAEHRPAADPQGPQVGRRPGAFGGAEQQVQGERAEREQQAERGGDAEGEPGRAGQSVRAQRAELLAPVAEFDLRPGHAGGSELHTGGGPHRGRVQGRSTGGRVEQEGGRVVLLGGQALRGRAGEQQQGAGPGPAAEYRPEHRVAQRLLGQGADHVDQGAARPQRGQFEGAVGEPGGECGVGQRGEHRDVAAGAGPPDRRVGPGGGQQGAGHGGGRIGGAQGGGVDPDEPGAGEGGAVVLCGEFPARAGDRHPVPQRGDRRQLVGQPVLRPDQGDGCPAGAPVGDLCLPVREGARYQPPVDPVAHGQDQDQEGERGSAALRPGPGERHQRDQAARATCRAGRPAHQRGQQPEQDPHRDQRQQDR